MLIAQTLKCPKCGDNYGIKAQVGDVIRCAECNTQMELEQLYDNNAEEEKMADKWDRKTGFCCATCYVYAPKDDDIGRCRCHAPTLQGWPVVHPSNWCGDHKIGSNPSKEART